MGENGCHQVAFLLKMDASSLPSGILSAQNGKVGWKIAQMAPLRVLHVTSSRHARALVPYPVLSPVSNSKRIRKRIARKWQES